MSPKALENSMTKNGTAASPKPQKYSHTGSVRIPNGVESGVNSTSRISRMEMRHAPLSFLLVKNPILNRERSDLILNA